MNECDQFAEGSRRRQICDGTSGLSLDKTNAYRARWGLPALDQVTVEPAPVVHRSTQHVRVKRVHHGHVGCGCAVKAATTEGPGTELLAIFKAAGVPSCQRCKELAAKMNALGADGCRGELESIIDDMLPRAKKWVAAKSPWIKNLLPVLSEAVAEDWHLPTAVVSAVAAVGTVVGVPDVVLRSALRSIVTQSIDSAENKHSNSTPIRSPVVQGGPSVHRLQKHSPIIPTAPVAFTEKPILTLVFHLWPRGDAWRRHLERLQPILPTFDRLILGIATDETTHSDDVVRRAFGDRWEFVSVRNDPSKKTGIREVATYQKILPMLATGVNDVTFCAHGKGAQRHTEQSPTVDWWTDVMYRTVLENHTEVLGKIAEGAAIVGSFRRRGGHLGTRHKWHYSGTFYAFRNCIAFNNGIPTFRQHWWGTESWPGDHFPISSSVCIFGDNAGDLYKIDQQPREEFEQWKASRGIVFG